jgi:hypothetical protein
MNNILENKKKKKNLFSIRAKQPKEVPTSLPKESKKGANQSNIGKITKKRVELSFPAKQVEKYSFKNPSAPYKGKHSNHRLFINKVKENKKSNICKSFLFYQSSIGKRKLFSCSAQEGNEIYNNLPFRANSHFYNNTKYQIEPSFIKKECTKKLPYLNLLPSEGVKDFAENLSNKSFLLNKFINLLMKNGEKSKSQKIVYNILNILKNKIKNRSDFDNKYNLSFPFQRNNSNFNSSLSKTKFLTKTNQKQNLLPSQRKELKGEKSKYNSANKSKIPSGGKVLNRNLKK